MKLWLDDLRPAPVGWTGVHSVNDAVALVVLSVSPWDAASLDHDLGNYSFDGGDGWNFVLWMIKSGRWPNSKPVVHSMNPVGRLRMVQDIDKYFPN